MTSVYNSLTDEMPTRWAFFRLLALAAKVLIVETPFKAFWKGLGKTFHPIEKKSMFIFEVTEIYVIVCFA